MARWCGTLHEQRQALQSGLHLGVLYCMTLPTVADWAAILSKADEKYDGTVAVFASDGSLSHRFGPINGRKGMNNYTREFDHQMDGAINCGAKGEIQGVFHVAGVRRLLLQRRQHARHRSCCTGMQGWDKCDGKGEFITDLFAEAQYRRVNAVFPLPA